MSREGYGLHRSEFQLEDNERPWPKCKCVCSLHF